MQTIKDVPLARNTFLHLRKRRYRCSCGKRFFEDNTFLPRYYRVTSRLVAEIIHAFEKVVSAKEIGCRFNVSGVTAMRYFRCVNHKPKELPEVVSLDEFKGNSGGQKYNSIVADPKNRTISFPFDFCGFGVWDGWAFCADFSLSRMDSRAAGFFGMVS